MEQLEAIYFAFFWEGPDLRYSMSPGRHSAAAVRGATSRRYEELMLQTDWDGQARSYLGERREFPLHQESSRSGT